MRGNYGGADSINVLVYGAVVGSFVPASASYQVYQTAPFTVAAGSHTVEFLGVNASGGDDTTLLDSISIQAAPTVSSPTVGDPGFEQVAYASGTLGTPAPGASSWTFSARPAARLGCRPTGRR